MNANLVRRRAIPFIFACGLALAGIFGSMGTASAAVNILDAAYSAGGTSGDGVTGFARMGVTGDKFNAGHGVALQSDGMIVTAGTYDLGGGDTDGVVLRYRQDGTADTAFNNNKGYFSYGGRGADSIKAVAIYKGAANPQKDKIILVGTYNNIDNPTGSTGNDIWVMRLNADGTLDQTFGPTGKGELVVTSAGADSGNAVSIDSNNKIVVVGTVGTGTGQSSAWIMRLNDNGSFDSSFNPSGTLPGSISLASDTDPQGIHTGNAVALEPVTGNIVVTGSKSMTNGNSAMWVLRVTPAGALDSAFGTAGNGEVSLGTGGAHTGNAVAIDTATGKILLVGTYDWRNHSTLFAKKTDIWVQRLNSNGTIDTTFYVNGATGGASYGDNGFDTGNAVVIQPDGMIVIVGTYDSANANSSVWVQRLKDDGQPSTTFNNGLSVFKYTGLGKFSGNAVALQADKKIVVAGTGFIDSGVTSTVMSLRLNGTANLLAVTAVGSGTVSASPGTLLFNSGLNAFVENYAHGDVVTVTQSPSTGWLFAGWSGACTGFGACEVTMDLTKSVTATFEKPRLTVTTLGAGSGTVTSSPQGDSGISCDSSDLTATGCSSLFTAGVPVTLSVTTPWYSTFSGWSGACTSTGSCIVPMDQLLTSVGATFTPNNNVRLNGTSFYSILHDAIVAGHTAGFTATVDAQVFTFPEYLDFNLPLTLTFNGGKGTDFVTDTGYTTVNGYLKIRSGRMNVSRLKIQPRV